MASNRMFLLHLPSKIGIMLGKHMNCGWYKAPKGNMLELFYDKIDEECVKHGYDFEDITIIMESSDHKLPPKNWTYGEPTPDGFRKIEYNEDEKL